MTLSMALVDFIPVVLFLISCIILQKDFYYIMGKGTFAIFSSGSVMVCLAGICKATWKLLYALEICDFERLNQLFFPMQAFGFLLLGISMCAVFFVHQDDKSVRISSLAVPAVFSGTMVFVAMMCFGVIGMQASMCVFAAKLKKKGYIAVFILSGILILGMGYLSSKDFSNPIMNWSGEITNLLAQSLFLTGVSELHKAGLGKLELWTTD